MYSPVKAFEKQIKTIEDQGIKQYEPLKPWKPKENQELKAIEVLFPKSIRNNEIQSKIDEIKKWEEKRKRKDLIYKANKYKYDLQQWE